MESRWRQPISASRSPHPRWKNRPPLVDISHPPLYLPPSSLGPDSFFFALRNLILTTPIQRYCREFCARWLSLSCRSLAGEPGCRLPSPAAPTLNSTRRYLILFRRLSKKRRNCPQVQSQKKHFNVRPGLEVLSWLRTNSRTTPSPPSLQSLATLPLLIIRSVSIL